MAIKDYIKPYDDNDMRYDYKFHRYILRTEYANFQTGLDLLQLWKTEENLEWYFEYVSRVVNHYIIQFKSPKYAEHMEYYLSHSKRMRMALAEIMTDTIAYNFEDGGFLVAYQTGVNLKEMEQLEMKIETAVSVVGRKIVRNYGLEDRIFKYNFEIEHDTYGSEW